VDVLDAAIPVNDHGMGDHACIVAPLAHQVACRRRLQYQHGIVHTQAARNIGQLALFIDPDADQLQPFVTILLLILSQVKEGGSGAKASGRESEGECELGIADGAPDGIGEDDDVGVVGGEGVKGGHCIGEGSCVGGRGSAAGHGPYKSLVQCIVALKPSFDGVDF